MSDSKQHNGYSVVNKTSFNVTINNYGTDDVVLKPGESQTYDWLTTAGGRVYSDAGERFSSITITGGGLIPTLTVR